MGHHSDNFIGEGIVRRDLRVPGVDKVPKNDSKKGVKLQINLRGRGQSWQELFEGSRWRGVITENTANERNSRLIDSRYGGRAGRVHRFRYISLEGKGWWWWGGGGQRGRDAEKLMMMGTANRGLGFSFFARTVGQREAPIVLE